MAVFKCKMCGGDLEINEKMTVGTCQYCGSTMTLPKETDDRKANLFNRANHFRRNNDFDKAMSVYENILNEDNTDSEAHWGVVLCKYGIEYIEDPKSHERVPTCHRTQFDSIFIDPDYKQAISDADASARLLYEAEAKKIDSIQKQILEISSREESFDIFICYKETDEAGIRTKDSVLAQDIYFHLVKEGYKIFFSRITLEDKIGFAYEPYIFAALHSSKVMVVVGTKPEHFSSTWTRNEWSRYLSLIKKGEKKVLIPAYRDMDPYDLPEEFSHLQALDMSKIGFIQDLVRGLEKVVSNDEQKSASSPASTSHGNVTTQSLLDRAYLCLEDGDFNKADELLEQVLNIDPRSASAYIAKLMIELEIINENNLQENSNPLTQYNNYQKAVRFADEIYKKTIEGYNNVILDRLETERKEKIYSEAVKNTKSGNQESVFINAAKMFKELSDYKDSQALAEECLNLAVQARIAKEKRDIESRVEQNRKNELNRINEEKKKKLYKRIKFVGIPTTIFTITILIILFMIVIPSVNFKTGKSEESIGNLERASEIYLSLGKIDDLLRVAQKAYDNKLYDLSCRLWLNAGRVDLILQKFNPLNRIDYVVDYVGNDLQFTSAKATRIDNTSIDFLSNLNNPEDNRRLRGDSNVLIDKNGLVNGFQSKKIEERFIENGYLKLNSNGTVSITSDFREKSNKYKTIDTWNEIDKIVFSFSNIYELVVGLKQDGSIVASYPKDDITQSDLTDFKDIIEIKVLGASGDHRSLLYESDYYEIVGLKKDGSVVSFGPSIKYDFTSLRNVIKLYQAEENTIGKIGSDNGWSDHQCIYSIDNKGALYVNGYSMNIEGVVCVVDSRFAIKYDGTVIDFVDEWDSSNLGTYSWDLW